MSRIHQALQKAMQEDSDLPTPGNGQPKPPFTSAESLTGRPERAGRREAPVDPISKLPLSRAAEPRSSRATALLNETEVEQVDAPPSSDQPSSSRLDTPDVPYDPPFLRPRRVPKREEPVYASDDSLISALDLENVEIAIEKARIIDYNPPNEALLVNPKRPREAPAEEFRTLRTRLNHLQTLQPLRTLVVTSASPAEGKSFTAANLAITQGQLTEKRVLLADFDFRRPMVDKTFQIPTAPGITDYLLGKATLDQILYKVADLNLYVLTAGEAVPNPLELLNLKECRALIAALREQFDWLIIDSPPLLFAADGNLLATMCDGTVLVVRIGSTTVDSVSRALQSLCENNVLGIVVNGARRGELYSKYTYYHDYYYAPKIEEEPRKPVAQIEAGKD